MSEINNLGFVISETTAKDVVSMPHAASGRLQQHHVGSPMILDLTGTIWREMQNYNIFSILEHVHKSEI